jgi:NADH-quinone oxidoreductase subunit L
VNQHLHLWLIPILPFIGFLLNGLLGRRLPKALVSTIALAFPLASLAVVARAALIFVQVKPQPLPWLINYLDWISAGPLQIHFTLALDQLTLVMLGVITGVGFLIHIYSVGYMGHEEGYWRYFADLNLFLFFMTVLVLAGNFLLMFVGWEGVGLASYLLIGFYLDRDSAANAGKKAFVVNRIGDFGFLIGIFLLLANFHSLDFFAISNVIHSGSGISTATFTAIGLCLLVGACGKSAQIPLYVWLPDAMEGPTPVSALIHAATMVTAGVYMIARTHWIFDRAPIALATIAIIGAATAFFAATVGLVQTDIKRVLAYSTISQLGYMFLACGVMAYSAGVFHLMTHAFFKALLFLGAGSVIHGLGGQQDMRKMGGLRKHLPITFWTMTMGVIAIAGIPPWAGFFSKDAILAEAFQAGSFGKILYLVGVVTAGLTSFYMFRLWYLTFLGESRSDDHEHHPHESPWSMLGPLVILGILAFCGGWIGIGHFSSFLSPVIASDVISPGEASSGSLELILSIVAVAVAALGWFVAHLFYFKPGDRAQKLASSASGLYKLLLNKYWIDELYHATIVAPLRFISQYILGWIGEGILIRGSAWLLAGIATLTGELLRRWQSGNLRSYSAWLVAGAAALLLFAVVGVVMGIGGVNIRMVWAGH